MLESDEPKHPFRSSKPPPGSGSATGDKRKGCVLGSAPSPTPLSLASLSAQACRCVQASRNTAPLLPMACQPLGAWHCALGFEDLTPVLIDGHHCLQHFCPQADVTLGEQLHDNGFSPNPDEQRLQPILTTCLAPTDKESANHAPSSHQLLVQTPSFVGDHTHGWDQMMAKLVEHSARASTTEPDHQAINLIVGFEQLPGNYAVLKQLLDGFGIEVQLLSDCSSMLDPSFPGTRTPLKLMEQAHCALATLVVRRWQLPKTLKAVSQHWRHNHPLPVPMGLAWTDAWLRQLTELSRSDIPLLLQQQRFALCQLIHQASGFLKQRSVAIYGEPDFVLGSCRLLIELGVRPTLVMCRNGSIHWRDALKGLFADSGLDNAAPILIGHSPKQERQALLEIEPDLLIAPPCLDPDHRFPGLPSRTRWVDLGRSTDADTPPCTLGYIGASHIIHSMLDASS